MSCQVFLITRQIRGGGGPSSERAKTSAVKTSEEKRRNFRKVESRRGGLLRTLTAPRSHVQVRHSAAHLLRRANGVALCWLLGGGKSEGQGEGARS